MSDKFLGSYDSGRLIIQLGMADVFGFGESSKITISRGSDSITPTEGVDGEFTLNVSRKDLGTLAVNLQGASKWNKILMNWYVAGRMSGIQLFPVTIYDPATKSGLVTVGWVQTIPDSGLGETLADREWTIGLASTLTDELGTLDNAINMAAALGI